MVHTDLPNRSIKTGGRVFELIEHVQELNGATLTELSKQVDMAVAYCMTILRFSFIWDISRMKRVARTYF